MTMRNLHSSCFLIEINPILSEYIVVRNTILKVKSYVTGTLNTYETKIFSHYQLQPTILATSQLKKSFNTSLSDMFFKANQNITLQELSPIASSKE